MKALTTASLTDQLADFVAGFRYEDMPGDVVRYVKALLLDSIACSIGGGRLPAGEIALTMMADPESAGGAGGAAGLVLATGQRSPVRNAAYLNSYLCSVMDFDDFYIVHPGVCAGPPVLAVADSLSVSGRDLLAAVALAYEVQLRVAAAIQPTPDRTRLVGGTSTPQVFGPAAATARLLRLKQQEVVNAFGLAAANAPVPHKTNRSVGGNPRPLSWVQGNVGWISMGEVLAAQMAASGFKGRLEIFDGEMGFWAMAGSDQFQPERLVSGLGERFELLNVAFKPYSCCRWIHSAAEALANLVEAHKLEPNEVRRIVVRSYPILGAFMDPSPSNFVDGQFSLPYILGLILCREPTGYDWLTEQPLSQPLVQAQARKVEFELDPSAADAFLRREYPAEVTVHSDRGSFQERVEVPLGDPRRPLSEAQLNGKYYELVRPALGGERADRMYQFVSHLETVTDVRTALEEVYRE